MRNCNCWLQQVFDDTYFNNYKPSAELMQQVRSDPRFEEFHSWANQWLMKLGKKALPPAVTLATLGSMSTGELRIVAVDVGISNPELMTRNELLSAIRKVQE